MSSRTLMALAGVAFAAGSASAQVALTATAPAGSGGGSGGADDVIADQLIDTSRNRGTNSQDFETINDAFDLWTTDDFEIDQAYAIDSILARGFDSVAGGTGFTTGVRGMILGLTPQGGPDFSNVLASSSAGGHEGTDIRVNFGGVVIQPGRYFVTVRAERPFATGGQWFWFHSTRLGVGISFDVNGSEFWGFNPGAGFGFGAVPLPISQINALIDPTDPGGWDLAYVLEGTPAGTGCGCVCDYDTSTGTGVCDFFDFITFQDLFASGDDCGCELDTSTGPNVCDFFDFISFQDAFSAGC